MTSHLASSAASTKRSKLLLPVFWLAVAFAANSANATVYTWTNGGADNTWSTSSSTSDWNPAALPTSTDTAVFNTGGTTSAITIGSGVPVEIIDFGQTSNVAGTGALAYTLGASVGSGTIDIANNGGPINSDDFLSYYGKSNAATETIIANLVIDVANAPENQYDISNDTLGLLDITGNITDAGTNNPDTYGVLFNIGTGSVTYSGTISGFNAIEQGATGGTLTLANGFVNASNKNINDGNLVTTSYGNILIEAGSNIGTAQLETFGGGNHTGTVQLEGGITLTNTLLAGNPRFSGAGGGGSAALENISGNNSLGELEDGSPGSNTDGVFTNVQLDAGTLTIGTVAGKTTLAGGGGIASQVFLFYGTSPTANGSAVITGGITDGTVGTTAPLTLELDDTGGTLTLEGAGTYRGGTTIIAGTLQVGNNTSTGSLGSGGVANNGVLNYDRSDATLVDSNAISGTGTVSMIGSGTVTLAGTNTYTGATTVSSGALVLSSPGSLGNTAVTVNGASGTTLGINGNYTIGTSVSGAGTVTVATAGNVLNMQDGAINTLTINNAGSGTALTLGGAGGAVDLSMDVGSSSDEIVVGGGGTATVSVGAGGVTVNINGLGGLNGTQQTLISDLNGGLGTSGFTLGTITGNVAGYNLSLTDTNTALYLNETALTSAYWTGSQGSVWNTNPTGTTNFNTTASGGVNTNTLPGAPTNVYFTANGATNFSNTTLGQNFTIESLTFNTIGVGIGGSNTLTVNALGVSGNTAGNGITVATGAGAGTDTISSNVALGSSQTWTVNDSVNTLAVSGTVSDGGSNYGLTVAGAGTTKLSGANTYGGGTAVTGTASLFVDNVTGSGTGTGQVNTALGTTMRGSGTLAPTGANGISISGNLHPGDAAVGTAPSGNLTFNLSGTTGQAVLQSGATLTFDLGAGGSNPSAELVLSTDIANELVFNNNTANINDLTGGGLNTVSGSNQYILVAGGSDSDYSGLTINGVLNADTNGQITAGLVLGNNAGYYASELFLENGDIVVDIVPEPSTWALMLGGLAMLVFYQRRKQNKIGLL